MLPELPIPGPGPHGNSDPGSSLLYHRALVEEARQLLSSQPSEDLIAQLNNALGNTSVDYIELNDSNGNNGPGGVPQSHLVHALYSRNPAVFGSSVGTGWNNANNSGSYNSSAYPMQQQQQQQGYGDGGGRGSNNNMGYGSHQQQNSSGGMDNGYQQQQQQSQMPQQQQQQVVTPVKISLRKGADPQIKTDSPSATPQPKMPKIMLNKLSKEAEEALQQHGGMKALTKDKVKAEEMGVYDSFTPRSRNKQQNNSYDARSDDDESGSEDEEKKAGGRNKFFKATEKERDEEKRKLRDERKKRRAELGEDDFEYAGSAAKSKRRRVESPPPQPDSPEPFVPKKVTRTVKRKMVPMIPMMSMDEITQESNTFHKFNKTVELIFDNMEEIDMAELEAGGDEKEGELPQEILINKFQLADLCAETAKLKSLGVMESISQDKLVKLLNILELNIRDGSKVIPLASGDEEDEEETQLFLEMAMERVTRGADASLVVMHILTSKKMPKRVYIDDVIDRVATFLRFQLSNTIYPSYDPVYKEISKSKTGYVGSMKKKRTYASGPRDRNILSLYNKTTELTSLLAELVKMQLLTDTTILHISSLGVAPFFVENIPELQLGALRLVTNLFSKYEKHRKLLLDDILASIARLPSSKRSLRTYRLNTTTYIQMLTALVLQLIQCTVMLPKRLAFNKNKKGQNKEPDIIELDGSAADGTSNGDEVDRDVLINDKYNNAMATALQFLTVFLKKCGSKNEDIDYRPLFENFVQDLLTTVNTPEWPAAEVILSLLGRVLMDKVKDRSVEMALRISSLEYLGVVAARLRKDAVQSKMKVDYIDSIVNSIKEAEEKEGDSTGETERLITTDDPEDERSLFLQRVLLDYMTVNAGDDDQAVMNARHFYICQWYKAANAVGRKPKRRKKHKDRTQDRSKSKKRRGEESSSEEEESEEENEEENDEENLTDSTKAELFRLREARKDFLVDKIPPFGVSRGKSTRAQLLSTHIDATSAHLIVKYLSSKRPFFNSFNCYLRDILKVLTEQSTHIRTKALKCMTMIVTEDPEVLYRKDMQQGVNYSFTDSSTMVREAAVDLVGKFIIHDEDLIDKYYKTITDRILDTGVSVRKRVIKILKDICLEYPTYARIPEMCVKMIRRINDEEGIRKLVMDVFQNMWFVPVRERNRQPEDEELLVARARNITDVVVASKDTGYDWFEQLLETVSAFDYNFLQLTANLCLQHLSSCSDRERTRTTRRRRTRTRRLSWCSRVSRSSIASLRVSFAAKRPCSKVRVAAEEAL